MDQNNLEALSDKLDPKFPNICLKALGDLRNKGHLTKHWYSFCVGNGLPRLLSILSCDSLKVVVAALKTLEKLLNRIGYSYYAYENPSIGLKLGKAIPLILDLLKSPWNQHLHLLDSCIHILGSLAQHKGNASELYRLEVHKMLATILQKSYDVGNANTVCQVFRFFRNSCHNTELAKLLGMDGIILKVSHLVFQDFTVHEMWIRLVDLLTHFYKFIKDIPEQRIWVPPPENGDFVVRLLELSWPQGSNKSTEAFNLMQHFLTQCSGVGFLRELGSKEAFQALFSAINDGATMYFGSLKILGRANAYGFFAARGYQFLLDLMAADLKSAQQHHLADLLSLLLLLPVGSPLQKELVSQGIRDFLLDKATYYQRNPNVSVKQSEGQSVNKEEMKCAVSDSPFTRNTHGISSSPLQAVEEEKYFSQYRIVKKRVDPEQTLPPTTEFESTSACLEPSQANVPALKHLTHSSSASGDEESEEEYTSCSSDEFDTVDVDGPLNKKWKLYFPEYHCFNALQVESVQLMEVVMRRPAEGSKINWPVYTPPSNDPFGAPRDDAPIRHAAISVLQKFNLVNSTELRAIQIILDHLTKYPRPNYRGCQILVKLSSNPSFFDGLIEMRFPLELYAAFKSRLPCNSNGSMCTLHSGLEQVYKFIIKKLSSHADLLKMENLLRTQESIVSGPIALSAPLLLNSRKDLSTLNKWGMLDLILEGLLVGDEDHGRRRSFSVVSLSALATKLGLEDFILRPGPPYLRPTGNCRVENHQEDVHFDIVDDGESVGAVKSFLQDSCSDYFKRILSENFEESNTGRIKIHGIESPLFQILLHLAYGCGWECATIRGLKSMLKSQLRSAVLLLEAMDYYLLIDRLDFIKSLIISHDWCPHLVTFSSLFTFLLSHGSEPFSNLQHHFLALPFVATCELDLPTRVEMVKTLMSNRTEQDSKEIIAGWKKIFVAKMSDD